jgi:antitoxin component YwqK of YwqJK toxin-antitoxin module
MKKVIVILFLAVLTVECAVAQKFQVHNGDTINYEDPRGLKQKRWVIFNSTKRLPGYKPDQKVEEGSYVNSRKHGAWKKFFSNGNVKDEINYRMNRPDGPYKVYYENGNVQEQGVWKNNRNIGEFKRFHENGKVAQKFEFNATGKREGRQQYFYENGQLMIEGNWAGGKESGELVEYYENGDVKAKKYFNDGSMDVARAQYFTPKSPVKDPLKEEERNAPTKTVMAKKDEKPNIGQFDGNGYHKLYNMNKQITKDGVFKNYRLVDGKWYKYDDNGILLNIEIIKNGKYIGDAPMDKE